METSRENMASALMSLGYEISRNWQFTLRDGERTPSAKIYEDGGVYDFGSGWNGDLISVLQEYKGFKRFVDAKDEAERLLGQEIVVDFTKFDKSSSEKDDSPLPDHFMVPHRIDAKNNRQDYLVEVKNLFLGECEGEKLLCAPWKNILAIMEEYDICYTKKSGRLIMPIRDTDGKIRTFWKYKKEGEDFVKDDGKVIKHRKVLYSKNKPVPPFAITDMLKYRNDIKVPVLVVEGEKDAMVALANGLRAICIGGAGAAKKLDDKYLELFRGMNLIIAGDYDEAGVMFNKSLLEQLKPIAKTVTILRWEDKASSDGFALHNKFDIADYFAFKNKNKELL